MATSSPFELLTAHAGEELASTALAACAEAGDDQRPGLLVIVVHPERDDHRVLSASGVGVLRAAVSVAVSSGTDRLWADAPNGDTIEHAARSLPEVLRAAAEAGQVVATHTGTVRVDNRLEAVAIWFETGNGVACATRRRNTLELLRAAATRDAVRAAQAAADEAAAAPVTTTEATPVASGQRAREFDPTDPNLDSLTGLATRDRFEQALDDYESDQAALVILDIDHFDQIIESYGNEVAESVLVETAGRLIDNCRKSDLVARLDTDTFAVLFGDADRATALQISKRLLTAVSARLETTREPESVTATVALAHQFGLVDTEELMESASNALRSGKRAGRGRLFIGS